MTPITSCTAGGRITSSDIDALAETAGGTFAFSANAAEDRSVTGANGFS